MLSDKDKLFISEIIKSASVQEIKEFSRKCSEILSKESKTSPSKDKSGYPFSHWVSKNSNGGSATKKVKYGWWKEDTPHYKAGEKLMLLSDSNTADGMVTIKDCNGVVSNCDEEMLTFDGSEYRGCPINPNSLFSSEEERQEFIDKFGPNCGAGEPLIVNGNPEYQNPTALILRQMADQIDSCCASIVKSDYVIRRDDSGVRTIISVEIFEGLTK